MNGTTIGLIAVGVVFTVDTILLLGLVSLKAVHRRRMESHEKRRAAYVAVLSRHLAFQHHTDPIGAQAAEDDAFLDALIDLRNIVSGREIETLAEIVDRYRVVERQSARLRSRFPLGRRLRAAVSLAEIGDESSARVLMEFLDDREPEVRIQCARGLVRMHFTPAIDAIVARSDEETPWVRARFADTLVGFGKAASWPLIAYIRVNHRHGRTEGVVEAIRVLGVIGDQDIGPVLTEILSDAIDSQVQIAIVSSLGAVGGPLAVPVVVAAFGGDDWRLRAQAAHALGDIGDPSVNDVLASGLEDRNWWVRRNSAAALARIPRGIARLYDALDSTDAFAGDAAAEALADADELAAARSRQEAGEATERDLRLIRFVDNEERVPA